MSGLEAVLAAHTRGDWSDRTYSCQGCRQRFEDSSPRSADDYTPEELAEWRSAYARLSHPRWTLADYNTHVAAAIREYLLSDAVVAAATWAAARADGAQQDYDGDWRPLARAALTAATEEDA